jgi:cyclohexa-1,5-dienecarbonyl-CoA hydratase
MANHGGALQVTIENDVAFLTLDNPPVNILTRAMMDRISDALREISGNAGLKAVALKSTGKAFSAGADIGEHRPEQVRGMIEAFGRMFRLLDSLELPIVAAVNGSALGAGFELAMMADVVLASDRATFGQPEIRLGFFAPVAVARLAELVGAAKAAEITCTGRIYSAGEMYAHGLVTKVMEPEKLEGALTGVLDDLRRASPLVMRLNVRTLKRLRGRPFAEALAEAERVFLDELMSAEDPVEGIDSFYEKRLPVWRNR